MKKSRTGLIVLGFVLVVMLLVGVNALVVRSETKEAEADVGEIVELPGGDVQVRDRGKGPPIVLLHGFAESIRWWDELEPLLARDNRVITFDLLGHGGSEKPKSGYSMEAQAGHVDLALRKLGVNRALIVGQSMGGTVATALAEKDASLVEGLVLIDTPPDDESGELPFTAQLGFVPVLGEALNTTVPDSVVRKGLSRAFAEGYEVPDEFVEDFRDMTQTSYVRSSDESGDFGEEKPLPERLKALGAIPLLVIFGSEDEIADPKSASKYKVVKSARIEEIDGAGHSPHVETPEQTARLILDFDRGLNRD